MERTVHIKEQFGPHLVGRDIGAQIRSECFPEDARRWVTVIDFTDVDQATESCLDEIFGTAARTTSLDAVKRVRTVGASKSVQKSLDYIFALISNPPPAPTDDSVMEILGRGTKKKRRPKSS
jgi:hypothetical protein